MYNIDPAYNVVKRRLEHDLIIIFRPQPTVVKRLLTILIFLSLAIPFAGTYAWLHFEKRTVKKAIKRKLIAGIDKDELVLLRFSKQDAETKLHWEHSKEFEYNGEMYDVVTSETCGDSVYYRCWWDHEETRLNKKLARLVEDAFSNHPGRTEKQEQLIDFIKKWYCPAHIALICAYADPPACLPERSAEVLLSFSVSPPLPPPRPGNYTM